MPARPLRRIWDSIADRGREFLGRRKDRRIDALCRDLLSQRGEASGIALARELVERYRAMARAEKLSFFDLLLKQLSPQRQEVMRAAAAYLESQNADTLLGLTRAVEPPRQELIRRINMAPDGTAAIVAMREDLLRLLPDHPELRPVEADYRHLLESWFNRGFLVLERIDWGTPAATLEKLFEYEAVHEIRGWEDMRRRLARDRRCFAFFHPALSDDPLIFVEVALLDEMASSIRPLLDCSIPPKPAAEATTAIFYSISLCQDGLRGISLGTFLVKQVVADLIREEPQLKTFATLSPIPAFVPWLRRLPDGKGYGPLSAVERARLKALDTPGWPDNRELIGALEDPLLRLCAHFLLKEKKEGEPLDPVARFHLGNGARIERINWLADTSAKGLEESAGLMVNYSYRLREIEKNHEAYTNLGKIAASATVTALLKKKK